MPLPVAAPPMPIRARPAGSRDSAAATIHRARRRSDGCRRRCPRSGRSPGTPAVRGAWVAVGSAWRVSRTKCIVRGLASFGKMRNAVVAVLSGAHDCVHDLHLLPDRRRLTQSPRQREREELPFADGSFEVVFCQQGLQYFPDRAAAMREMSRVLTPGGRLSLNVWGPLDRQPFDVVYRGLRSRFFRARSPDSFQPRLFPEHSRRASEACDRRRSA